MLEEQQVKKFKKIFKKVNAKDISYDEAEESANSLANFFQLLLKINVEIERKNARLKNEPTGFPLEDGPIYNCLICHRSITGNHGWWDKYGQKCLPCQKAIDKKVVPGYICRSRDSWYAMWELKDKFGIHPATAKKMIKEGKLKARIITNEIDKPHEYIFIKKENKELKKWE